MKDLSIHAFCIDCSHINNCFDFLCQTEFYCSRTVYRYIEYNRGILRVLAGQLLPGKLNEGGRTCCKARGEKREAVFKRDSSLHSNLPLCSLSQPSPSPALFPTISSPSARSLAAKKLVGTEKTWKERTRANEGKRIRDELHYIGTA